MENFTQGGATDDRLGAPRRPQRVAVSRITALVNNLLEAMYGAGDDAEATYKQALEELRANADEAAVALARMESECDRGSYPRRWGLIYAATQLEHEALLPFLRQIVLTPLPPEQSTNPHSFSTVKEETVLRTTAIEGVGALAARGHERAVESLFEFLSIESISIRRAAVQSLLATDRGFRDRISEYLPRDFQYLLDIRPTNVTDVPQVKDPTQHLRDRQRPEKPQPPDPEAGDNTPNDRSPRTGG